MLTSNSRILRRDGGTNSGGGWYSDGLSNGVCPGMLFNNCSTFCTARAGLTNPHYQMGSGASDSWPYYIKCYDTNSASPLNGIRMALPSQSGTTDIDPIIPILSLGNIYLCLRMRILCMNS